MTLLRCTAYSGNTTIAAEDPHVETYRSVIYAPAERALYDQGRKLITGSGYFRGAEPELIGRYTTSLMPDQVTEEAPDDLYFYAGPVFSHYGHFLTASLARMWAYERARHRGLKLVTFGDPNDAAERFSYVGELFGALGVSMDDMVAFDRPVRLRRIIVPSPCFEEANFAHHAFRRMCRDIGAKLLDGTVAAASDVPIYLARYKLEEGVGRLEGEEEFASVLADHGVDIVFPEQLDMAQKARLMTDRHNIVGIGGSAFHAAAFVPPRKLMMLLVANAPQSNQILIDRVCGHDGLHLYSPDGIAPAPKPASFHVGFRLTDPQRMAADFLRILDPFMRISPSTVEQETAAYGAADGAAVDGWSRTNIALNRPTRQSSVDAFSRGLSPEQDSFGAVRGFCIGTYQFHTALEECPWWDVDFGGPATVEEVRLFNRLDAGVERSSSLALLVSDDGRTWREVLHRMSDAPFGGMDGNPFVWSPPDRLVTRFLRVMLLAQTILHLDQVVIYGVPPIMVATNDAPEPIVSSRPAPSSAPPRRGWLGRR
jgi:hypothetical protein